VTTATDPLAAGFEPHRRRLSALAYRMLGSVAEAEDIVQEAWLRWQAARHGDIADPAAFLSRVVSRLCLDHLRTARVRRETYVGPWLPEPVLDSAALHAGTESEYAEDLTVALMLALERLSPLERAAFLLHDVFEMDFPEIAETLGRNPAACRQLAARARLHIREARPRFAVSADDGAKLAGAFLDAARTGDAAVLARLLAETAVWHSDGGGKRAAALNPIYGRDKIIRFLLGVVAKAKVLGMVAFRPARINTLPGFVATWPDGSTQTLAFEIRGGAIAAIYTVLNPDKLRHVAPDSHAGLPSATAR
jgi:RNA polymerase sigma-70 factor (ECF subfamily)